MTWEWCLRKYEVTVKRISGRNIIENSMEHGIHCLSCSYTNEVIATNISYLFQNDDTLLPFCQGTENNSWSCPSCFGNRYMLSPHL